MKEEKNKIGWGGKRVGAGRKKSPATRKTTSFRFKPETITRLEKIKGRTQFVEDAIIEKLDRIEKMIDLSHK